MEFTAEHEQFRKVVRSFIENEINPHADEWEAARTFPAHELFPKMAAIGAFGLEYDEEYGGQGADHSYTLVLMEELGGACDTAGVPMAISVQTNMATPALYRYGTHELKTTYLKPAMEGTQVCSVAVSEPDAGSDVAGIRTRARRDGDDWVINGRKMWITSGSQADWICMLVRTSDEGGFNGTSQIIVPTDTPGFSVGRTIEKMGNHSSDTAELVLDDVRVPVSNTIGEIGRGFQQQMNQFQDERLVAAYMTAAGARRALERTIEYLRIREAFGKPLLANQYLQYHLAELIAEVDLLLEYNRVACERKVAGQDVTRMATIAKLKCGRLARQVADAAVQYHGGMGYAEENWPARYLRDSRLISIGGGADEVMLRILSLLEGIGEALMVADEEQPDVVPVRYEVSDGVATITFNRPEARNALDPQSMGLLADAISQSARDGSVRVVVLTGTGDTFSAGADLKAALSGAEGGFAAAGPEAMGHLLATIQDHPKPTLARVQGNVYGGGNGLVAACDLSVAADHVRFAFSEVRLGLTPAVISVVCLRRLHPADAAELFLLGERVPAERVRAAGMINAVVPADGLDAAVSEWAAKLRLGGPNALAGSKELLRRVPAMDRDEGFAYTAELSGRFFRSDEAREGMSALLQKRPPAWAPDAD